MAEKQDADDLVANQPAQLTPACERLFSQLKGFQKSLLSKTETKVTTEDGKTRVETHDDSGIFESRITDEHTYGFVADMMMDFQVGEILPGLIMASQDVAAELPILEKYGVTHILNVATYVKNFFPDKIKYINVSINDYPGFHILPYFQNAFEFIDEGRKGGCVLVHCNAGRSRAATITIGYLMKTEHMTLEEAFAHVKEKRPSMSPNAGFMVQLETYGERLGLENRSK